MLIHADIGLKGTYIESLLVLKWKFIHEHVNPNRAGLLDVAWVQGGGGLINPKHYEKTFFLFSGSLELGPPDPFFHREMDGWKKCRLLKPPTLLGLTLFVHVKACRLTKMTFLITNRVKIKTSFFIGFFNLNSANPVQTNEIVFVVWL